MGGDVNCEHPPARIYMVFKRRVRFVDIGTKRFIRGRHYHITSLRPIDITKGKRKYVKRVNILRFYAEMLKASLKDGIDGLH